MAKSKPCSFHAVMERVDIGTLAGECTHCGHLNSQNLFVPATMPVLCQSLHCFGEIVIPFLLLVKIQLLQLFPNMPCMKKVHKDK